MSTNKQYSKKKKSVVPTLRFKSFKDQWMPLALESVTEKIQDGTHFSPVQNEQGNYKYITSKNIRNGFMDLNDITFLDDEAHKEIYKRCDVKFNDVLLTKDGASTGAVCLNELREEFSLLSSVAFLRADDRLATNNFLYQVLVGPKGQSEIQASIAGQAITRITLSKIRSYQFYFPSLPEQRKIASFLGVVDKKIQQLTRKKELLEQYKKGVIQQFFSGKLRFKNEDGKAYPRWEEKRLGDVGKIRMCKRIFSNQTTETGDVPFYKIGTFGKIADAYISRSLFSDFKEKYPYPRVGDVLISASGTLGRTVIYDGSDAYFQDSNIVWIENDEELVTNAFLFYVYQIVRYKSEGGTIQRLYNDIINRALFLRPSLPEQYKVASFLSAIDKKIESVTNQVTQIQAFKRGLLQQMFV